ncbi:TonB-dependent receptor [Puteibacter caeruleilacunae]|nr:TonB-dependent receptor [Puteibacter caeruleilacunae]
MKKKCSTKEGTLKGRYLFLMMAFFLISFAGNAQSGYQVKGTVSDDKGELLPGVSVIIKGTTQGTVTNFDGEYEINVDEDNSVLVFSFIGFAKQEVVVAGRKELNVILAEETVGLDEVVAVGYGSMKKTDLTGAVAQVKMDDVGDMNVASVDQALQGRMSGVTVMQNSGQPGGSVSVRIRGGNSISGDNEPLYVIDGFPVKTTNSDGGAIDDASPINPLAALNPEDIESIEVLKDAASTSIYGAEGANGVILITTKTGKSTKGKLQLSAKYSLAEVSNRLDLVNRDEFILNRQRAYTTGTGSPFWNEEELAEKYPKFADTDWQDLIFRTAKTSDINVSFVGNSDKTDYRLSLGLYDQEGVVKQSDYKRASFRYNFDSQIYDWLKLGGRTSASYQKGNFASTDGAGETTNIIQRISYSSPLIHPFTEDGDLNFEDSEGDIIPNPLSLVIAQDKNFERNNYSVNLYTELKLLPELKLRITGGLNVANNKSNQYLSKMDPIGYADGGHAKVRMSNSYDWLNENILTYSKDLGDHSVTLTGVFSQNYNKLEAILVDAQQFSNENLSYYNVGAAEQHNPSRSTYTDRKRYSYVGRFNYGYKSRYLITGIIRADGDSRFSKNNKFGVFPSLSAAWRLSEESFIKDNFKAISNLKLRFGAGRTGNPGIAAYASLPSYESDFYIINDGVVTGYSSTSMGNSNLKWETTDEVNAGIDLSLWRGRFDITLDTYSKLTKDLLLIEKLPLSSGYAQTWNNVGEVSNKGIEVALNGRVISKKDFSVSMGANFSYNKNVVEDAGKSADGLFGPDNGALHIQNSIILKEGEALGSFYGYKYKGVWQQNEVDNAALYDVVPGTGVKAEPGDPRYLDVNGDEELDDEDKMILGNALPIYNVGVNMRVRYKQFTLSGSGYGAFGHEIFNMNRVKLESNNGLMASKNTLNAWRAPGTDGPDDPGYVSTTMPRLNSNNFIGGFVTDRWIEKGDFFKIANITFAYNVKGEFLNKLKLSNLRLSVTGQDLFMFTDYSGYTPEVNSHPGNSLNMGHDEGGYPPSRMITFGLNATF